MVSTIGFRPWMRFAFLMLGVGGFVAADPALAQGSGKEVRIISFPLNIASLPVWTADKFGFFEAEKINFKYVSASGGATAQQAMVAGQADIIIGAVPQTASLQGLGIDAVVVTGQMSLQAGLVACGEKIDVKQSKYPESMQQLVGKTIGISGVGAGTDSWLRYSMIAAGVDPAKASIIPVGATGAIEAALRAGTVDCAVLNEPVMYLMRKSGYKFKSLVDWQKGEGPDTFKEFSYNAIVTMRKFDVENPDLVQGFARAIKKAVNLLHDPKNADAIAEKTISFLQGMERADLANLIRDIAPTFRSDITPKMVENALLVENTALKRDLKFTYEQLVAPSTQRAAK